MRFVDRLLSRQQGYNEHMYSGAYPVTSTDALGRDREAAAAGLVRGAREAYAANGIVFAADLVRMSVFSEARFKFQSAVDDHMFGNTDLTVLEHPFPGGTAGELLARMTQDDTTAGNSYWRRVIPADGGDPLLVQLPAENVVIVSEQVSDDMGRPFRRPVGYEETFPGTGRDPEHYTTGEVAHYSPCPDPNARWKGMSWLSPLLREVRADSMLTDYRTEHLRHGALPGLVIRYPQKLAHTVVERLKKRFEVKYGGPANAGRVFILDQGADATVAGSTLEQLQFDAVSRAGERRVCAAAGPGMLEILGFEAGDYQAAIRKLADVWARPHWRMACAALEHLVPTSADIGPVRLWFDVSGIAALREGELQRAQSFLVKTQGLAAAVTAGFTRESAVQAADSGDLALLKPDPGAGVPGAPAGTRPPQAGVPEALPGVVAKNLPNAQPWQPPPMPGLPNGARGPNGSMAALSRGDGGPFGGN